MNNPFQIIILSVFLIAAVVAMLIFGGVLPGFRGGGAVGQKEITFTVWGALDANQMGAFLTELKKTNKKVSFSYREISPASYENVLIEAFASGQGPDLWLISNEMVLKHKNKAKPISFNALPLTNFKNTFADATDLFLDYQNQNIIAMPLTIDPLVMYYNESHFNSAFITLPPQNWREFIEANKKLTQKQGADIKVSGTALGSYENIKNAKEILSAFILQTGSAIVGNNASIDLGDKKDGEDAILSALSFYSSFSDARSANYAWNKFFPDSFSSFIQGKLSVYFGMASEFEEIRQKNPNLDFDAALLLQSENSFSKTTYGRVWGVAMSYASRKSAEELSFGVNFLTSREAQKVFGNAFYLAPARRDVLARPPDDQYKSVFYKSAVVSRAWLDPDPKKTSLVFKNMVEFMNRKEMNTAQALTYLKNQLASLLK